MDKQQRAPDDDRPLDEHYDRVRRDGEARGKGRKQAKRDAAKAVHEQRRDQRRDVDPAT